MVQHLREVQDPGPIAVLLIQSLLRSSWKAPRGGQVPGPLLAMWATWVAFQVPASAWPSPSCIYVFHKWTGVSKILLSPSLPFFLSLNTHNTPTITVFSKRKSNTTNYLKQKTTHNFMCNFNKYAKKKTRPIQSEMIVPYLIIHPSLHIYPTLTEKAQCAHFQNPNVIIFARYLLWIVCQLSNKITETEIWLGEVCVITICYELSSSHKQKSWM